MKFLNQFRAQQSSTRINLRDEQTAALLKLLDFDFKAEYIPQAWGIFIGGGA